MTQNTQIEALLASCPFCGGEPILRGADAPEFWVACNGFGCKAQTEGFGSKEKAIAAWNRRALREAAVPSEEPVAFVDAKGNLLIPDGSPLPEMLGLLGDDPFGVVQPLFASPAVAPVASVKDDNELLRAELAERLLNLAKVGLGYDIKPEDRDNLRIASAILSSIIPATKGGVLMPEEPTADHLRALFQMNSALPRTTMEAKAVYASLLNISRALTQDTDAPVREVAWLIERKFPAEGLLAAETRWYSEFSWNRRLHFWSPTASRAKRFASKAEAEAYPAYQMIASDPAISITEHVFLAAQGVAKP